MRWSTNLLLGWALAMPVAARAADAPAYKHVLLISVDGLHAVDLTNFLARPGTSWLKRLAEHGVVFPNAFTTAPSDSFPGTIAQVTGASPRTAGVFYDDSYDRTYFPPGSDCTGAPGSEMALTEDLDRTLDRVDGGGSLGQPLTQIDPARLPRHLVGGACVPVLPHEALRANTVFEVAKAAGLRTAWADKHPAYEILQGPSGNGIDDLFTPEINAVVPGFKKAFDAGFASVRANDDLKVRAVLNQIAGRDSLGQRDVGVPAIFGMNFQAVSVGQKLAKSGVMDPPGLVGGYLDGNATPGNALAAQLDYVDASIGRIVQALDAQKLTDSTLIIASSKHGQSPIDGAARVAVEEQPYAKMPGYGFHIADDVALVWLQPQSRTPQLVAQAKAYLLAHAGELHIVQLLDAGSLRATYPDPLSDSRTPDFIAVTRHGAIYTHGGKLAEHGGFAFDDRAVALLVSAPGLPATVDETLVETKQIAPTILAALGLDPTRLLGVRQEGTQALPLH